MTSDLVEQEPFGVLPGGEPVHRFTLRNVHGLSVQVLDYGGIVTRIMAPDRHGTLGDIVLGHDALEGYLPNPSYLGALIGRYANRLAQARFTLDGESHVLAANEGPHALHGGREGFDQRLWQAHAGEGAQLRLRLVSPDGDQGFPGALQVDVTYTLTEANELVIAYVAHSSAPTPVNLTNHTYWNLSGNPRHTIDAHWLLVHADCYTPVDAALIPTGEMHTVFGTPFDFRTRRPIGSHPYDHNLVLSHGPTQVPRVVAELMEPESGRMLTVRTTEPGLQFYSGNFLNGSIRGKGAVPYAHRTGLCLETQHFPNAPNAPAFPNTVLRPGQAFHSTTVYAFGTTPE